jgi:Secretion system C-terminal sorting domain
MKKMTLLILALIYNINLKAQKDYYRTVPVRTTMDNIMGLNVKQESVPAVFSSDALNNIKNIRKFQDWSDDVGDAATSLAKNFTEMTGDVMKYKFNTTLNGNINGYRSDQYYQKLSGRAVPVLNAISPWMRGYTGYTGNQNIYLQKPINTINGYSYDYTGQDPDINLYMPSIADQKDPKSYINIAKRMTITTERYGSTILDDNCHPYYFNSYKNELKPGDRGLNFIKYYECYNETDKFWLGDQTKLGTEQSWYQIAPNQLGAMLSASYDGHGQSTNFKVIGNPSCERQYLGIKNVDFNAKLVFPGVAEFRGQYINDVIKWCVNNRTAGQYGFNKNSLVIATPTPNPVIPFDVINFHHYSTKRGAGNGFRNDVNYLDARGTTYSGEGGISPEEDELQGDFDTCVNKVMVSGIDDTLLSKLADKEVWLSEFGWDTGDLMDPNDPIHSPEDANKIAIQCPSCTENERIIRQGQWLQREYLMIANTNQIDKAHMYEAADGDTKARYFSAGIFKSNYNDRKASYYFYTTLQNVLTGYWHDAVNANLNNNKYSTVVTDPNDPNYATQKKALETYNSYKKLNADVDEDLLTITPNLQKENIYCYKFKNKDGKLIYAVWYGTSNNTKGTISLPLHLSAQVVAASKITTVVPNENGEKTNINPSYIVNTSAPTHGSGTHPLVTFTNLEISETPIFILVGDATAPPTRPSNIIDLKAVNTCCRTVKLTWNSVPLNPPCSFNIYYTPKSVYDNLTDIDLTKLTLYKTNIHGASTSAFIAGLDPNIEYTFIVLPFNCDGYPYYAADFGGYAHINIKPSNCGTGNCITTPNNNYIPRGDVSDLFKVTNGCSDIYDNSDFYNTLCKEPGWNTWDPDNKPSYIVDFGKNVKVPVMYYFNSSGSGQIMVEYMGCSCPDGTSDNKWRSFTTFVTKGHYNDSCIHGTNGWESISDFITFSIRKLRFTKMTEDAKPQRIYFCTEDAECISIGGKVIQTSGLRVKTVGDTYANLNFNTVAYSSGENLSLEKSYKIALSSQWIGDSLVNPINIDYLSNSNNAINEVMITNILPTTTYKVKISLGIVEPYELYCAAILDRKYDFQPLIGTFTTTGSIENGNNNAKQRKIETPGNVPMVQPEIFIYPNPTHSEINISLPYVGYTKLELYNINGKLMHTYTQDPVSRFAKLETSNWGSGMYILRAYGLNIPILNSKVVKE